jgi:hypothetical protein
MKAARRDGENVGRDPEIARAEAAIARTREELGLSVVALQREISHTLDWREWIADRPLLAVAVAFGVGALLGGWRPGIHGRST